MAFRTILTNVSALEYHSVRLALESIFPTIEVSLELRSDEDRANDRDSWALSVKAPVELYDDVTRAATAILEVYRSGVADARSGRAR